MQRDDKILLWTLAFFLSALVMIACVISDPKIVEAHLIEVFLTTAVAAFAGVWGAQAIAERAADRRILLAEISATNFGIALAATTANGFIVAKKQLLLPRILSYRIACAARQKTIRDGGVLKLDLDLTTLDRPTVPIEDLSTILRDRITHVRSLMILAQLVQSMKGLSTSVKALNVVHVRMRSDISDDERIAMYFGTPLPRGGTDRRYSNIIDELEYSINACISFAILLCELLCEHGKQLAKRAGPRPPKIVSATFNKYPELLPDLEKVRKEWAPRDA